MIIVVKSFDGSTFNIEFDDKIEPQIHSLKLKLSELHEITDCCVYEGGFESVLKDQFILKPDIEYFILPKRDIIAIKLNEYNIAIHYSNGEVFLYSIENKSFCGTFKNIKEIYLGNDEIIFLEYNGKICYINYINDDDDISDSDDISDLDDTNTTCNYKYKEYTDITEPIDKLDCSHNSLIFLAKNRDNVYIMSPQAPNIMLLPLYNNSNIEDVYIIDESSTVLLSKTNKLLTTNIVRKDKHEITDHSIYTVKKVIMGIGNLFIILENGELLAKGINSFGQLGHGGNNYVQSFQKVKLPINTSVTDVFAGKDHTGILTSNGNVFMCGDNRVNQLGLPHSETNTNSQHELYPIPLTTQSPIKKIYGNKNYTILLNESNQLYAIGNNDFGKLGLGHSKNAIVPEKIEIENEPDYSVQEITCKLNCIILILTNNRIYYSGESPFCDEQANVFIEFNLPE